MPEGDTIYKAARTLERALAGQVLTRFEMARLPRHATRPAPGTVITGVESRGKHLLVHFADGLAVHTHLGMPGSWHLYRAGERWQRPAHQMRVRIDTDNGMVAVCFNAPTAEVISATRTAAASRLAQLGPDLCRPDADLDEVLARMARLDPDTEIATVLLDQRVAAGVGNVYKSEVLFACGVSPFLTIGTLDDDERRALIDTAARLLRANLDAGPRRTQPGGGLAVYGRAGRPCPRCATAIRTRRHGPHARSSYWCPRCQPPPSSPPARDKD